MLVLLMKINYQVHVEMGTGGMIYTQSFMKTGTGVDEILRFCFSNLKGFNVYSTD